MANNVIIHWSTPRSMSTLFEKVISQIKSVTTLHEPFTNDYYFGQDRKSERYGSINNTDYQDGKTLIEHPTGSQILFIKELAFQGEPYISDKDLIRCDHSLMIRHPSKVLSSLLKLKPNFTEDEFGFVALQRIHRRITNIKGEPPLLIDGDVFRNTPEESTREYTKHFSLPYSSRLLQWEDGAIRKWGEHEKNSQSVWHSTLEGSKGIIPENISPPTIEIPTQLKGIFNTALSIYLELTENNHHKED